MLKKTNKTLSPWKMKSQLETCSRKKSRAAPLILPGQSFWTHLLNHVRVLTLHARLSSLPHSTKVREVYSVKFFLVSSTLLNRSGQGGLPCLSPLTLGKALSLIIGVMLALGFFVNVLYWVEEDPLYPYFPESFYLEWYYVRCFLCVN